MDKTDNLKTALRCFGFALIMLLSSLTAVAQSKLASKVTLDESKATVETILKKIETQTGLSVVISTEQAKKMPLISITAHGKSVKQVLDDAESACAEKLVPVESEIAMLKLRETELHKAHEGKKDEGIPTTEKDELKDVEQKLTEQKQQKDAIVNEYAASNKIVHQLIDLALLQNNMLKGEALNNFVKRSVELI